MISSTAAATQPADFDNFDSEQIFQTSWEVFVSDSTAQVQQTGADTESLESAGTAPKYVVAQPDNPRLTSVIHLLLAEDETSTSKAYGAGFIQESSVLLQEWEGVVLDQEGNCFTARLHEGQRDFPAKRATIPFAEVSDNQQKLVVPGATFYWIIGYRVRHGTRTRISEFYFRQLPPWTQEEIDSARAAAIKLGEDTGWI